MSYLLISGGRRRGGVTAAPAAAVVDESRRAEITAAVAAEVAALRAAAEAEGRAKGEAEARAALAARETAMRDAAAALRAAAAQLAAPLAGREQDLADLVVEMSFELARHVVGQELARDPAGLRGLLRRLMQEAAAERGAKQSIVVRLNPADQRLIDVSLLGEGAHALADAAITPGGAVMEIVTPEGDTLDRTEWDATVEGRLAALREALGDK